MALLSKLSTRLGTFLWQWAKAHLKVLNAPTVQPNGEVDGDGVPLRFGYEALGQDRFLKAYAAGQATGSWWDHDLRWRAYVVCWAAMRGRSLSGDFVECGVHRGGYSRMLAEYVDLSACPDKALYLIDTYCGIPERYADGPAEKLFDGVYTDSYESVLDTFAPFPNAVVIRGVIPDILDEVAARRVCYLSIDLNSAAPSAAAAAHFWPLMMPGAVMVLDDYGFPEFADQRVALDRFASSVGVEILSLPTGQGLLFKT